MEALAAPPPAADTAWTDMWSDGRLPMAELTYRQAVAAALGQEMARDDGWCCCGEDIASGGVSKTTLGLLDRFGAGRVRNTPSRRPRSPGSAMGAAMAGLRPVAEIMSPTSTGCAGTRSRWRWPRPAT